MKRTLSRTALCFFLFLAAPAIAQDEDRTIWSYQHWNIKSQANFKSLIEDFVNAAGPRDPGGIMGALTPNGLDFHVWVREDKKADTDWKLKITDKDIPISGSSAWLRDIVVSLAGDCEISIVGFSESLRVWYFQKTGGCEY